jgi:hypothetical protein
MLEKRYEKRVVLSYKIYLSVVKSIDEKEDDISYVARTLGQLVYNKFGKVVVGISENAKNSSKQSLTHDHFNNCQKVGEYLFKNPNLSKEEFVDLIIESRKTIIVTKKENSELRNFQKSKNYGEGLEAYQEAKIEIHFF